MFICEAKREPCLNEQFSLPRWGSVRKIESLPSQFGDLVGRERTIEDSDFFETVKLFRKHAVELDSMTATGQAFRSNAAGRVITTQCS